jgi:hypothetical protein
MGTKDKEDRGRDTWIVWEKKDISLKELTVDMTTP